jgi:hypothetical protein
MSTAEHIKQDGEGRFAHVEGIVLRVELEEAARQVLLELESELLQDEEHGPAIQHDRTQVLFEGVEEEDRINLLSREGIAMGGSHQGTACSGKKSKGSCGVATRCIPLRSLLESFKRFITEQKKTKKKS